MMSRFKTKKRKKKEMSKRVIVKEKKGKG